LQVLPEAVVDGEGDDEGSYTRGYSEDRDAGDYADEGLAAFSTEIAGGDEEFEAHEGTVVMSVISGVSHSIAKNAIEWGTHFKRGTREFAGHGSWIIAVDGLPFQILPLLLVGEKCRVNE
jgi:hypothetical protein